MFKFQLRRFWNQNLVQFKQKNTPKFSSPSFLSGVILGCAVTGAFSLNQIHASWADYSPFRDQSAPKHLENKFISNSENETIPQTEKIAPTQKQLYSGFIADAVENVMDSVINITVESDASNLFSKKTLVSSGSGFAIREDGMFLTNAHVVSDFITENAELIITDSQGLKYRGTLYGIDPLSDLAVIKISSDSTTVKWNPVKFSSSPLRPGEWVISIGCPFGLQGTVTAGIVSSRRKNTEIGGKDWRVEYIQTDCVVHTGSSGGPLINLDGEVVGINTTRAEGEGISFAIRAHNVLGIVDQLMNKGSVVRPWIGVRMVSLTKQVKQQLKENSLLEQNDLLTYDKIPAVESGVLIANVLPRSPASSSGLEVGDVLVAVNNKPVKSSREIMQHVGYKINEPVLFTVKRAAPLDMDWDGRVRKYETIEMEIRLTPEELDVRNYSDRAEYLS